MHDRSIFLCLTRKSSDLSFPYLVSSGLCPLCSGGLPQSHPERFGLGGTHRILDETWLPIRVRARI